MQALGFAIFFCFYFDSVSLKNKNNKNFYLKTPDGES